MLMPITKFWWWKCQQQQVVVTALTSWAFGAFFYGNIIMLSELSQARHLVVALLLVAVFNKTLYVHLQFKYCLTLIEKLCFITSTKWWVNAYLHYKVSLAKMPSTVWLYLPWLVRHFLYNCHNAEGAKPSTALIAGIFPIKNADV